MRGKGLPARRLSIELKIAFYAFTYGAFAPQRAGNPSFSAFGATV